MSILKTIAVWLYNRFVPADEIRANAFKVLDSDDRYSIALTMFARGVHELDPTKLPYKKAVQVAEDLVVLHNKASGFNQLCRNQVRRISPDSYFRNVLIDNTLAHVTLNFEAKPGTVATELFKAIDEELTLANLDKNPIKRRAIVRKGIQRVTNGLSNDQLSLLIELVLL